MTIINKTMKFLEKADRTRLAIAALVLAAITLLAVNVFANTVFHAVRLDLTQEKLFTLSPGTIKALRSIDEPITVRLYFSKILGEQSPLYGNHYTRVRELLEQYADIAGGKLKLEFYDPEPFSGSEDRAVAFGLQGAPVDNAGDLGYFGLAATNSTDDQVIIPFFSRDREAFLEYDLTKMIHTLTHPKKKVVGLISSIPINGRVGPPYNRPSKPWMVMDQIREFFDVWPLDNKIKVIPKEIDTLMIVHPRGLSDNLLYAIDQFVLRGGTALVFVDPNAETSVLSAQPNSMGMPVATASDFNRLLTKWGVTLVDNKVVGDLESARRVTMGRGKRPVVSDYVLWLALGPDNFDRGDVVTGDISTINMATAGILEPVDGAGTKVTPLIHTGVRSMEIDADKARFGPDPVGLLRDFRVGGKPLMLAARISGKVKTAFPDGPPPDKSKKKADKDTDTGKGKGTDTDADKTAAADKKGDKEPKMLPFVAASTKPLNVIVVADVDMLYDNFWVSTRQFFNRQILVPEANNADFVVNALDNLTGGGDIIALRGRGGQPRTFSLVQRIRSDAEQRFRAKEQQLDTKLKAVKAKLTNLQNREGDAGEALLTADEKASLRTFRREMVSTRRELRSVKHAMRSDIETLGAWLKFINIAAVPLLLGMIAIVVALVRRRRRARAATAPRH